MLNLYIDETCQNNHHYMVIGGISLPTDLNSHITNCFDKLKSDNNIGGEVKWTKVSKSKLDAYMSLVDGYFRLCNQHQICFHSIIIDQTQVKHAKFNQGDVETGFSKFIYQLLVSNIGRKYASKHGFNVYLDYRTIDDQEARLSELKNVMNNGISHRFSQHHKPYKRVEFRRSKKETLLQVSDLLIGAIGFHKNERHLITKSSAHKKHLANHIARSVGVKTLGNNSPYNETKFNIWNFNLR
ncbi:MAG: DUF3800 domain-containing protein [Candidatus Thiodiazotropha lotti]|nr:DUF3800 domain-containing protein [Candidatus Thiodiazotropha lotti]MCG8004536.1 DUF3800 domain-containing protein [Candidatus Thiodiazotropha lotti]MCG8008908.1 DUF3800 domain-containing protein [Candidatus Thiodiazotropha lotti]MCW4188160.1 DUF3800 domain-containing protein [Candidatus Thiodiazotropha lotti]MCW4196498.1 DUF3800 domain-containing protein [Candidatus Thiodiazotropha lotti]